MHEILDPHVFGKVRQMEVIGVHSTAEVHCHFNTLFHGEEPPPDRHYNPMEQMKGRESKGLYFL